jgi:hypothetical protein
MDQSLSLSSRALIAGVVLMVAIMSSMSQAEPKPRQPTYVCASTEKAYLGITKQPEVRLSLKMLGGENGRIILKRIKDLKVNSTTFPVKLVMTDKETKGYLPGFLIARAADFSMSLRVASKPLRGTLWLADMGERDGLTLRCNEE